MRKKHRWRQRCFNQFCNIIGWALIRKILCGYCYAYEQHKGYYYFFHTVSLSRLMYQDKRKKTNRSCINTLSALAIQLKTVELKYCAFDTQPRREAELFRFPRLHRPERVGVPGGDPDETTGSLSWATVFQMSVFLRFLIRNILR